MVRTVAVIGGGISGLAAAWELSRGDGDVSVTLLEGSDRLDATDKVFKYDHDRDPKKWKPVFGQDHARLRNRDPKKWKPVFGQDHAQLGNKPNGAGAAPSARASEC